MDYNFFPYNFYLDFGSQLVNWVKERKFVNNLFKTFQVNYNE
jgi:hypothetical protein